MIEMKGLENHKTYITTSFLYQHYSSDESCLSAFQSPLDPSTALGGFSGNNYSQVLYLDYFT